MDERVGARLAALRRHLDGYQDPPIDAATRLSLTPVSAPLGAPRLCAPLDLPPRATALTWPSLRSGLGERPVPGGGKGTLTVKDSRTGNTYEIQVRFPSLAAPAAPPAWTQRAVQGASSRCRLVSGDAWGGQPKSEGADTAPLTTCFPRRSPTWASSTPPTLPRRAPFLAPHGEACLSKFADSRTASLQIKAGGDGFGLKLYDPVRLPSRRWRHCCPARVPDACSLRLAGVHEHGTLSQRNQLH